MQDQQLIQTYYALESDRASKSAVLDLVDRFISPGRGRLYETDEENSVDYRSRELYDETAGIAAQTLAAAIHSAMTNPVSRFFDFRFNDDKLNSHVGASSWLANVRDLVYSDLMDSNFNVEVIETYLSDVLFGDALLTHSIDKSGADYFRNLDVKNTFFTVDFRDRIDGLYVKREYTLDALQREFGWLPDGLQEIVNEAPHRSAIEKREVLHVIYRDTSKKNVDTSKVLAPAARPFQEKFILFEGASTLNREPQGYYEMPGYLLRWSRVAGSKHSFSPAINILGTVMSLNQLVEVILAQAEKAVDPPVITLDRGVVSAVDLRAGGQTVVRDMNAIREFVTSARFDVSQLERQQLIASIRSAFYVDQLELRAGPQKTATEVNVLYQQMQRIIGPSLTRVRMDLLDPLLQRKFAAVVRQGRAGQVPQAVIDSQATFDVQYTGAWNRAQRADNAAAMEQSLMFISQLVGAVQQPQLLDNFDMDALAREIALERGVAAKFITDEKLVANIRAKRAEQQQIQQELAAAESTGKAAKDLATAESKMNELG